jgi:hypothetical protein
MVIKAGNPFGRHPLQETLFPRAPGRVALVLKSFSFSKQEDISAHIDRNPDDAANSKEGLIDIQID